MTRITKSLTGGLLALVLTSTTVLAQNTLSTKSQATSLNATDTTWWCQTAGSGGASGCGSGQALNSLELSVLTTYLGTNLASTFLTKANNLSDVANTATARTNLGLGTGNSPAFTGATLSGISGSTQCLQVNSSGVISGTGSACGSSGGGITLLTGDGTTPSGGGSQPLTLATVNSNVGSFTNANITVNAKGLITAAANGSGGGGTGTAPQAAYFSSTNTITGNTNVSYQSGFTRLNYLTSPSSAPTAAGALLQVLGPDTTNTDIDLYAFGANAKYRAACAGGTGASPTAVGSGVQCGAYTSLAYNGTTFVGPLAGIGLVTSQAQSSGNGGMEVTVAAVPNNTTTPVTGLTVGGDTSNPPNVTVASITGSTQCVHANSSGVLSGTGSDCSGATSTTYYSSAFAGGPTTYTAGSLVPSSFTNATNAIVCTNTGSVTVSGTSATLNVGSTAAYAIDQQSIAGLTAAAAGAIQQNQAICFQEVSSTGPWVLITPVNGTIYQDTNRTLTAGDFAAQSVIDVVSSGVTVTLPNLASTTLSNTGAAVTILTHGNTVTLQAAGTDVINSGQPGASAAGGTINIGTYTTAILTTTGTAGSTAWRVNTGTIEYMNLTWAEGLNLSAAPRYIGHVAVNRTVLGISCNVQTATGATGTLEIFATASGTAPGSGTRLDTTACNLNTSSNTNQTMLAASLPTITAGYNVWAIVTGTGTAGNGGLNISFQ